MTSGREHFPTQKNKEMVKAMTAYGVPQAEIAAVMGIHRETLAFHYREEIDTAVAKANSKVAERLYQKAMSGDTACMIFWLKTRAKWAETVKQEISGPDGGALKYNHTLDVTAAVLSKLPTDTLNALLVEQEAKIERA